MLSTSNRLGRVVDRVRTLADMAEEMHGAEGGDDEEMDEKRRLIFDQLAKLTTRIHLLVPAITTLYTAIGLLVASSISVGVVAAAQKSPAAGRLGCSAPGHCSTRARCSREARLAVDSRFTR